MDRRRTVGVAHVQLIADRFFLLLLGALARFHVRRDRAQHLSSVILQVLVGHRRGK
jgi:hypothetical protein